MSYYCRVTIKHSVSLVIYLLRGYNIKLCKIRYGRYGEKMNRKLFVGGGTVAGLLAWFGLKGCTDDEPAAEEDKDRSDSDPQQHGPSDGSASDPLRKPEKKEFLDFSKLEVITDQSLIDRGKYFFDPNRTNNPLYRITEADLEKYVSDNFKLKEYVRIDEPEVLVSQLQGQNKLCKNTGNLVDYIQRGRTFMRDLRLAQNYGTCQTHDDYVIEHEGKYYFRFIRLDPKLIAKTQNVRDELKEPIEIKSGYRPYGYNIAVYVAGNVRRKEQGFGLSVIRPASYHQSGMAVDIQRADNTFRDIVKRIFRGHGIGSYVSTTHFDVRPKLADGRTRTW